MSTAYTKNVLIPRAKRFKKRHNIIKLVKGRKLYRASDMTRPVNKFNKITWYALTPNYGSYGNITETYVLRKDVYLLNLGRYKARLLTLECIPTEKQGDYENYIDPDIQYSGGRANKIVHENIMKYFNSDKRHRNKQINGTYINEQNVDDDDLEGPTEVVLFGPQEKLVKHIPRKSKI